MNSISRRGFLGSVLGIVAASPFLALTDMFPMQRVLLPYHMLFRDLSRKWWMQAPGVEKVITHNDGIEFLSETLFVKQRAVYDAVVLLDKDRNVIMQSHFCSVLANPGDTVRVTQKLSVARPLSLEEVIHVARTNQAARERAHPDAYFTGRTSSSGCETARISIATAKGIPG